MTGAGRGPFRSDDDSSLCDDSRRLRDDDRAQTVLDYGMAVGLFFVALVFVLGVVPGMFDPFTAGSDTGIGDRVATSLAADHLGDPAEPYVLDEECTWEFFDQLNGGDSAPTHCRYDTDAADLESLFGVGSTTSLNVTVTDFSGDTVVFTYGDQSRTLTAGDPLPARSSVTTARRTVHLDGETYRLGVSVW